MPRADKLIEQGTSRLRLLLYGRQKTKKTTWAAKAAEAGFNVILIEGDNDGALVLKNLDRQLLEKIYVIDVANTHNEPVMALFMAMFCAGQQFYWNQKRNTVSLTKAGLVADDPYYLINAKQLDNDTVVVIDSWTALVWALTWRYAIEKELDFGSLSRPEWEGYGWTAHTATWILKQLISFPAHLIVIGHEDQYQKVKNERINGKNVQTVLWQRTQIKSTSGNHAGQMGLDFSDILYCFYRGSNLFIDTTPKEEQDSGSRTIPPKVWRWEELQFKTICEMAKIRLPDNPALPEVIVEYDRGDQIPGFGQSALQKGLKRPTLNQPPEGSLKVGSGS